MREHEQQESMKIFFDLGILGRQRGGWAQIGSSGARVGHDGHVWLKKFSRHAFFLGPTGKYKIPDISTKFCQKKFPS
jgi:hypothetical protein